MPADGERTLIGITGPPGCGKSTIAAQRAAAIGPTAIVVPMDGFHLASVELARRGLSDRKGTPETFDLDGFVVLLARLRNAERVVMAPAFVREIEEPIAGSIAVEPHHRTILVEGNYLLHDRDGWDAVRTAPRCVLVRRRRRRATTIVAAGPSPGPRAIAGRSRCLDGLGRRTERRPDRPNAFARRSTPAPRLSRTPTELAGDLDATRPGHGRGFICRTRLQGRDDGPTGGVRSRSGRRPPGGSRHDEDAIIRGLRSAMATLVLIAAACGGSDDSTDADPGETTVAPTDIHRSGDRRNHATARFGDVGTRRRRQRGHR